MPILHSIEGTVSQTDHRRFIECGCGWRYTSSLEGERGRLDCSAQHKQHQDSSEDHAKWRDLKRAMCSCGHPVSHHRTGERNQHNAGQSRCAYRQNPSDAECPCQLHREASFASLAIGAKSS